ncbi:MAG: hypothetical protein ACUVSD_11795 [Thiobacillaceae bacterium]
MLILLTAVTLALLLGGVALPRFMVAPPAFWVHLVLAVGVMSLITAAMQHFVPVLCRGRGAGPWMGRLPWLMFTAGLLAAAVLMDWLEWGWIVPAALLALTGAALMVRWMAAAARAAVGGPHPGLAWYLAAMVCLMAGLAAAALIPLMPGWHGPLRAFHVHINLYGFVALTAVGTLQVLLPTVANRPDPEAGRRLRQDLKWALTGSVLLASGQAADLVWLAAVGVALWGWVIGRMLRAWVRLYGKHLFALHGNAPPLLAASLGLIAALLGGLGLGTTDGPLGIFLPGFVMPLISGAAAQLSPIWLRPGRREPWHDESLRALGRWGGPRALLFLSAAVLPLLGYRCAGMPAVAALVWFGILFILWLLREEPAGQTRKLS